MDDYVETQFLSPNILLERNAIISLPFFVFYCDIAGEQKRKKIQLDIFLREKIEASCIPFNNGSLTCVKG